MFSTTKDKPCEDICYEDSHINTVLSEIENC